MLPRLNAKPARPQREPSAPRQRAADGLWSQALQASPHLSAQRRSIGGAFGAQAGRADPTGPTPVAQLKLDQLSTERLAGHVEASALVETADLVEALQRHAELPDAQTLVGDALLAAADALDVVAVRYRLLIEQLETLAYDTEPAQPELIPAAEWLRSCRAELRREMLAVVLQLPLSSQRDALLQRYPDGALRVGGVLREVTGDEAEPAIGEVLDGRNPVASSYQPALALPFSEGGAQVEDVKQGLLGDCWLLAPLIALMGQAEGRNRIHQMISPNDRAAEAYTVTLFIRDEGQLERKSVVVSSRFPSDQRPAGAVFSFAHNGRRVAEPPPLWPALIEKAMAMVLGGYPALAGSTDGARTAFEAVMGQDSPGNRLGELVTWPLVTAWLDRQVPVVVASGTHYYSVQSADGEGAELRNPHGKTERKTWVQMAAWHAQVPAGF